MLAMSVFHAIRDAVASCGVAHCLPPLVAPATPEAVLRAVMAVQGKTLREPTAARA
jgi:xanthine dehydrogenase large subunit